MGHYGHDSQSPDQANFKKFFLVLPVNEPGPLRSQRITVPVRQSGRIHIRLFLNT